MFGSVFAVLESTTDAALVIDDRGSVLYSNEALTKTIGWTREQLISKNIRDILVPPSDENPLLSLAAEGHGNKKFTCSILGPDDGEIPLACILVALRHEAETGYCLYISPQEKTAPNHQDLNAQREFYQNILEHIPTDIAIFDEQHRYVYVNPYGIRDKTLRAKIIGMDDFEYLAYRGRDTSVATRRREKFEEAKRTSQVATWEDSTMGADGIMYTSLRKFYPVLDTQGNFSLMIGFGVDITDRKQLEGDLLSSFQLIKDYKYALDAACIVSITDTKGRILHANEKFCQISKYTKQDLEGQPHSIIASGYHPASYFKRMWQRISKGEIWAGELCNKARDGTLYWVDTTIVPLLDSQGKPYQYLSLRFDISQRKKAEKYISELYKDLERRIAERTEELQRANEELKAFNSMVSHDLQSPLRSLSGFSSLLLRKYDAHLDHEGQELLQVIDQNAKKMSVLIKGLLQFSQLGKASLAVVDIDVREQVADVISEFQKRDALPDLMFALGELPPAKGDLLLMRQVWINLVSNAIKYSFRKQDPKIAIGSSQRAGEIIYYVQDNGCGFDEAYSNKLFNMFQRLHNQDEYEGTGVGLALVHRIITKHGGRIWAESKVGQGATFYFTLGTSPRPE